MYCLTVTHHTALGYEERVDRKVTAFMGDRQKVFKEACEYLGDNISPALDYVDINYEERFNALIRVKNGTLDYYEYHLQLISND